MVQQSCLSAWQAIDRFDGDGEPALLAWLRAILRNNIINGIARLNAHKHGGGRLVSLEAAGASTVTTDVPTPSACAEAHDVQARLQQALDRLSDEHHTVLRLRHEQGLGWEDVGKRMGRTADAARMLGTRALQQLRLLMGDANGGQYSGSLGGTASRPD